MNTAAGKALGLKSDSAMTELRQQGKMSLTELADAISKADEKHDAETAGQVRDRMQSALGMMVKDALQHHDKNVLAVSSGMSIGIMISDMTNDPLKNKGMGNAAAVKIEYRDGKYQVKDIGDMRYVEAGKKLSTPPTPSVPIKYTPSRIAHSAWARSAGHRPALALSSVTPNHQDATAA